MNDISTRCIKHTYIKTKKATYRKYEWICKVTETGSLTRQPPMAPDNLRHMKQKKISCVTIMTGTRRVNNAKNLFELQIGRSRQF
jgi:hypothetical protein